MPGSSALPDQVDQFGQEAAHRGGPAVQVHLGEEEFLAARTGLDHDQQRQDFESRGTKDVYQQAKATMNGRYRAAKPALPEVLADRERVRHPRATTAVQMS
ncbi:hypothetical protein GCM10027174_26710 [Salinifilum aidingensis]